MKKNLSTAGTTLIEILLAIFIIGTTFVLFQASVNTVLLNRSVKNQEQALRIAQTKIESLRNTNYANLPASGSFQDPALASLRNGQGAVTVVALGINTKEITVTVTWTGQYSGVGRSVTLKTIITQGGL